MNNQVNHARAAMDVLAALQGGAPTAPEAPAERRTPQHAASPPTADPAPTLQDSGRADHATPPERVPPGLDTFTTRPRRTSGRLTALLLVLAAAATGITGWAAVTTRDATLGGLALILGVLTLGLWFMRVIAVPTTVTLRGPRLEVRQGHRHHVWDLASPYCPVDHVRGRPGRPGWRVVLRNADGSSFAIDGSMVPARRFTEILSRYRPEL
jgi:hypothetical protein